MDGFSEVEGRESDLKRREGGGRFSEAEGERKGWNVGWLMRFTRRRLLLELIGKREAMLQEVNTDERKGDAWE